MGASQSQNDQELSDFDSDCQETDEKTSGRSPASSSVDEVDEKLRKLKLKYQSQSPSQSSEKTRAKNAVKLYLHIGGNTPKAKWIISESSTSYSFIKINVHDHPDSEDEGSVSESEGDTLWALMVCEKIKSRVSVDMQLKTSKDQLRVDFVAGGVWAMKFFSEEGFEDFFTKFQDCLFENVYGLESTDENKVKVYGKEFIGWGDPDKADDSIWEDPGDDVLKSPQSPAPDRKNQDLREEFEEVENRGIQSLTLGALDNSFLVGDTGVQVVKNLSHGIHGKGGFVIFSSGSQRGKISKSASPTPKKALLMKAETNMLLMSPINEGVPYSTGLHQLDVETGKVVTEWKVEKDGTDITMRDIANDSKGAQLDPSGSTFLGLDCNMLCRWDMRDKNGMVQTIDDSTVLNWTHGHQFSRGTNFQCFASTGDGSIVVGSLDGKIRLYSSNSMRQAKTAFPGLGSPVTHVDVTYDGKWILGTTDTYLILINTLFIDKDGNVKNGFSGRMGNRIAAPRLLKLTPLDSHLAGKDNKFRNAQFSWVTENGKQERHLVATVGKFSVVWNFVRVKNSSHECYRSQQGLKSCYCYKTVVKDDSIVDSRFMHDKFALTNSPEAPLVIATPTKVSSFTMSSKH